MVKADVRSGAKLRKRAKEVNKLKTSRYQCAVCGKNNVKRVGNSLWKCGSCKSLFAGGAYSLTTSVGETAKRIIKEHAQKS